MGDGWETARRRGPGNDWVVFALGHAGVVDRVEVDTAFFKGNYPDSVMIQATRQESASIDSLEQDSREWAVLLPQSKLGMDQQHFFESLESVDTISHVRMNIYPDGGVSRLRLFGRLVRQ